MRFGCSTDRAVFAAVPTTLPTCSLLGGQTLMLSIGRFSVNPRLSPSRCAAGCLAVFSLDAPADLADVRPRGDWLGSVMTPPYRRLMPDAHDRHPSQPGHFPISLPVPKGPKLQSPHRARWVARAGEPPPCRGPHPQRRSTPNRA